MSCEEELSRLRADIDALDTRLVSLIEARARIAIALGEVKRAAGRPLKDAPREAEILSRLTPGLTVLEPGDLVPIYRALMGVCLEVQRRALEGTPPEGDG